MYFLPYWIFVKEKTMGGEVLELESEKLIRKECNRPWSGSNPKDKIGRPCT